MRYLAHVQKRLAQQDSGLTLIELMVTMALASVLGLVLVVGVQNNQQLHRSTVDESSGLADVKTVVERLGRDVRSARSIDSAATQSKLVLWVDYNSDYIKTSNEIVTWQLVKETESGTQYNVLRQTEGGQPKIEARTLVSQIAFCYWVESANPNLANCTGSLPVPLSVADAAAARLVTTTTTYDAKTTTGTQPRSASFSSRLRNVA